METIINLTDEQIKKRMSKLSKGEIDYEAINYKVVSPDGFGIESEGKIYKGITTALISFKNWAQRYKRQGYYSSVSYGKIDLLDLEDYCQFIETKEELTEGE